MSTRYPRNMEETVAPRDLLLVQDAIKSRPRAVHELLERLKLVPRVLVHHNARLGRPLGADEVEDLVQEVVGLIWSKLGDFAGHGPFEAWAYRFSVLTLFARIRKLRRFPATRPEMDDLPSKQRDLARDVFEIERLHRCLGDLEPRESTVIRLKHLCGYTFEAIARELDLSPNTAKARYYRGMIKLRKLLNER